jgi:hypothetical protein
MRSRDFRQAVDGFPLQVGSAMLVSVPFGVGRNVGETEIGREIDDLQVLRKSGDDLLCRAVRQPAEDDIDTGPVDLADRDEAGQAFVGEMRKYRADRLAGLAVGGQRTDLDLRMIAQQSQQLGPGVAAGPEYCDPKPIPCGHEWPLLWGTRQNCRLSATRSPALS